MSEMVRTRLLALLAGMSVVAAACGSGSLGEYTITVEAAVTTSTTISEVPVTTTTSSAPAPTTTTTTVPVDPYETFVANVKPEVTDLTMFQEPDGERAIFEYPITNPTYFGNPLTLMIIDRSEDERWLKVQIPVRPNGTEAWIRVEDAEITSHRYHAEINLTERSVTVWNGEEVVAQTSAVIGKEATPTPLGSFFVNDLVQRFDGSAYGPYILSLSAFSEALETFAGGVPVIAIHGTNNPGLIGGAYSNGCIRIPNEVIRVLADTVPMGTPVDILA